MFSPRSDRLFARVVRHELHTAILRLLALSIVLTATGVSLYAQAPDTPTNEKTGEQTQADPQDAGTESAMMRQAERDRLISNLIKTASEGEFASRCTAIRKLARLRCMEAVPVIVDALADKNEQVRALAVDALGTLADPATIPKIGALTSDPSSRVAVSALRALGQFTPRDAVPYLIDSLNAAYEGVRYQAAQVLSELTGFDFGFRAEGTSAEREQAARHWASWWETARAGEPRDWWIAGLKEGSPSNRAASARRLAEIATDSNLSATVPALVDALADESAVVRYHVIRALERLTMLRHDFDESSPDAERTTAVESWRAWWAANKDRTRPEWLVQALRQGSPIVRARAAAELGLGGDRDHVPLLAEFLLDDAIVVRESVVTAIERIAGLPAGTKADAPTEERERAAMRWKAWWDTHRARAKKDWLAHALLNETDPVVRSSAARSLGSFPEHATVPLLLYGMQDGSAVVRAAAIATLRHITGMSFDFDAEADAQARASSLARLKEWWFKEGASYVFPSPRAPANEPRR
ncbi:MAG: HEAT repeat domain-containing protein [Planctomycetota bacterium]|nr:HEAT repeat domain-containing protein [Planctomycetota bacterium]